MLVRVILVSVSLLAILLLSYKTLISLLFCLALILVIIKLYIKFTTGWCRSQVCLQGKTVIVTGANTGIGYQTAIDLAKRGAKVILACRSETRAKEAQDKIIRETHNNNVTVKLVDFLSLKSIRKFAEEIKTTEDKIDILVNNAGVYNFNDEKTEDGLLELMQVNYFSPVLLTELLLDLVKKSSGRIVNVASIAAKYHPAEDLADMNLNKFNKDIIYPRSKLCNVLYTIELASRLEGTGATTYSLHPGIVLTDIFRNASPMFQAIAKNLIALFFKSDLEGAQTTIYCAVEKGIEKYSGEIFEDCHVVSRYKTARDPKLAKSVWSETKKILKLN